MCIPSDFMIRVRPGYNDMLIAQGRIVINGISLQQGMTKLEDYIVYLNSRV
jgi:riboflavin synthase alpha subunit